MDEKGTTIYRSGYAKLMRYLGKRQRPFENAQDLVPPLNTDLNALWTAKVPPTTAQDSDTERYDIRRKHLKLQKKFEGAPEILLLHGY